MCTRVIRVIRRVANFGGAPISHKPVRGPRRYFCGGQWRKGELRHLISSCGCLHLDVCHSSGVLLVAPASLCFYELALSTGLLDPRLEEVAGKAAGIIWSCHAV